MLKCERCKKIFTPSANGQKYCKSSQGKLSCFSLSKKERNNEARKRKYCEDEKFRRKKNEYSSIYHKTHRTQINEYVRKHNYRQRFRFNILLRDNFGRKPPEVKLEVDHRFPQSKGGKTTKENLITSCADCNRGKGDLILKAA